MDQYQWWGNAYTPQSPLTDCFYIKEKEIIAENGAPYPNKIIYELTQQQHFFLFFLVVVVVAGDSCE